MSTGSGKKEKRNVNNLPLMRKVVASVAVDHVVLPHLFRQPDSTASTSPLVCYTSCILSCTTVSIQRCTPGPHSTRLLPFLTHANTYKKKRSIQSHPCRHAFCLGLPWPRCPSFVPVVSTSTFHLTVTCDRPTM